MNLQIAVLPSVTVMSRRCVPQSEWRRHNCNCKCTGGFGPSVQQARVASKQYSVSYHCRGAEGFGSSDSNMQVSSLPSRITSAVRIRANIARDRSKRSRCGPFLHAHRNRVARIARVHDAATGAKDAFATSCRSARSSTSTAPGGNFFHRAVAFVERLSRGHEGNFHSERGCAVVQAQFWHAWSKSSSAAAPRLVRSEVWQNADHFER